LGGAPTAATRRMPAEEPATPVSPVPPAPPRRPAPAPRPMITPAEARPQRSLASRTLRALGILLLIAVLAGLIAGAVLLLTDAGQGTDVGELIQTELDQQIDRLEDFIRENTQ
ncbi:MAG: hypothetical protein ACRDK9_03735, partial [Solirubrobacterales bacterium]